MDTKGYLSILPLSVCLSTFYLPTLTYLFIPLILFPLRP